ncbi:C4-dicarboxylate ABC transporter substrate-binding protein [Sedimentitalea sp. CY04]|uniref:C4-dicarboxylate ABC transporter substrate-binding protein n=1 Tax=Parasedimentitalea denitrificans TaxID=2211118 RepID=A0ABX0WDJ2_9RHOB|nr:C4-dicarboxylate TRAP transporter substrate-binding protein [Sedimentitalea sp. CY04]NIZ62296.1 C4-dicarboxylate ABC transporter substrate-binding protein [Sedimentitalea sp. CY04]
MKYTIKGLLTGASLLALAPAAFADQLNFAGGWPPNSRPNSVVEDYAAALSENSGGALTMKVFPQSLLSFGEANAGLRDGMADLAVTLTPYFPTEFPNMNMVSEFAELTELPEFSGELSSAAFAGAISEYVMTQCTECKSEAAAQNQVFMGASMTTSYVLQCVVPINSPEELKGKRIRTAGAYWSRWAESVGAVPVSISVSETFEALNQGVLDCTASNTADFMNFSFIDAVKYVYAGLPGGQFTVPTMMNKDRWDGLSAEGKSALMKANAKMAADMTWVYVDIGRNGKTEALERGLEYGPAADSLLEMNRSFIENDITSVAAIYDERFGLKNGAEVSTALRASLGRWTALIADVDSAEALAEVYWNEIYSKIDVNNYGM